MRLGGNSIRGLPGFVDAKSMLDQSRSVQTIYFEKDAAKQLTGLMFGLIENAWEVAVAWLRTRIGNAGE